MIGGVVRLGRYVKRLGRKVDKKIFRVVMKDEKESCSKDKRM